MQAAAEVPRLRLRWVPAQGGVAVGQSTDEVLATQVRLGPESVVHGVVRGQADRFSEVADGVVVTAEREPDVAAYVVSPCVLRRKFQRTVAAGERFRVASQLEKAVGAMLLEGGGPWLQLDRPVVVGQRGLVVAAGHVHATAHRIGPGEPAVQAQRLRALL